VTRAPGRAAITLLVLLPQLWIFQGGGWNQNSRFALARALVVRGSVQIDPDAECTGDKAERGGHVYSDKAPGVSFAAAAALAVVGPAALACGLDEEKPLWWRAVPYAVTLLSVSLPIALTAGLLYAELAALFGALAAALAILAVFLGSPMLGYAGLLYGHALAGALLVLGWVALRRASAGEPSPTASELRPAATRAALLAGLAAGAAILVEYPAALGALALALYAFAQPRLRREIAWAALGALPPLLLLALYQQAAFGNPLSPGYAHLANGFTGMSSGLFGVHLPRAQALWQLTFGVHRGLFRFSPALLLALPGAWLLWRAPERRALSLRPEALLSLGLFAAFLALNAGYIYWDGHASFGPRHALPGVPLLAIPLAAAAQRWPRLCALLLVPSLLVCGLAWATHPEAAPLDWDPIRDNWLSLWSRDQIGASVNWFNSRETLDYRSGFSLPMLAGLDGRAALLPLAPLLAGLVFWWQRAVRAGRPGLAAASAPAAESRAPASGAAGRDSQDAPQLARRALAWGALLSLTGAALHLLCIPDGLRERSDLAHYLESAGRWALDGAAPYREIPFEYPPAALLFLRAPVALVAAGLAHFDDALALVLAPFDALALFAAFLLARAAASRESAARRLQRGLAALAFAWVALLLCGSLLFTRFDLAPAALLALGCALVSTWPRTSGAALGAAAALKLYPFWPAPALAVQLWRERKLLRAIAAGLAAALALSLPAMLPAGSEAFSFLGYHASRGVQIQSLWGSLWMVLGQLGAVHVELAHAFGADEVSSAPRWLSWLATLLPLAWMAVAALSARRTPASLAALSAICGFVALGKIGSPQFSIALAPLAAGALFEAPLAAGLVFASIALGAWQFPFHHVELMQSRGPWAALGLLRMLLVAAAGVSALRQRSRAQAQSARPRAA